MFSKLDDDNFLKNENGLRRASSFYTETAASSAKCFSSFSLFFFPAAAARLVLRVRQNARKARKTAEAAAETFVSAEADDGGEGGGGGGEGEGCGGEGGGGGEGGEGGGEGATQEILIVLHELAGPVTTLVHVYFA